MLRKALILTLGLFSLTVCQPSRAAVLGTYTFDGNDPSGDASAPALTGMTFGLFSRANVTANNKNNVFSSTAWNTGGSIDTSEYVEFVLTPDGSHFLQLQNITFDNQIQGGANPGPTSAHIEIFLGAGLTSKGGQDFTPSTSTANVNFNFTDFDSGFGEAVTVRFYGWNANSAGFLDLDNVAINGTLAVPEPINLALAVFGLAFCGSKLVRRLARTTRV